MKLLYTTPAIYNNTILPINTVTTKAMVRMDLSAAFIVINFLKCSGSFYHINAGAIYRHKYYGFYSGNIRCRI